MSDWGDLKSSCHGYLPGGAYYVSCQKRLLNIKYGFGAQFQMLILAYFRQTTNYYAVLWHFGSVKLLNNITRN